MLDAVQTPRNSLATLTLGAVGVVYGDIGTSPLYAFREALGQPTLKAVLQHVVISRTEPDRALLLQTEALPPGCNPLR